MTFAFLITSILFKFTVLIASFIQLADLPHISFTGPHTQIVEKLIFMRKAHA